LITKPLKPDEALWKIKLAECIESYIGHEATAKLLEKLTSRPIAVNRAIYSPEDDDYAIIVRLKKRLEKPEDVKNVTESDIEFIEVMYIAGREVPLEIDKDFNVRYIITR
jgi:hypothetical protein